MAGRRGLPLHRRPIDILVLFFLFVSIFYVTLFEAQAVLPPFIYPKSLQAAAKWHIRVNGDYFLRDMPAFFRGIVWTDIFVKTPLLFLNFKAFYYGRDWGRLSGIFYGVHASTSLVPMMFDITLNYTARKYRLYLFYGAQLIVALYVLLRVLPVTHPFSTPYPFFIKRDKKVAVH